MRNAGDGMPSGSAGRRQRAVPPEASSRLGGNGGASLFTPAYRVSHGSAGTRSASRTWSADVAPGSADSGPGGAEWAESGFGRTDDESGDSGIGYQPPGYADEAGRPSWSDDEAGSPRYPWADDGEHDAWAGASLNDWSQTAAPQVSNAVRGFPPAPGDSLPSYPPGPFAAWNRAANGTAGRGGAERTGGTPGETSPQLAAATITPDEFDTDYSLPAVKDPAPGSSGRAGAAARSGRAPTGTDRSTADRSTADRSTADRSTADRAGTDRAGTDRSVTERGWAKTGTGQATPGGGRAAAGTGRARQGSGRAHQDGRGPASPGRSAARGRGKHQSAWLAIGTAVVIIVVGTVILVLTSTGGPAAGRKAGSRPHTPAVSSPTAPAGRWVYIGSRKTDTVPLTMHELYPATFISGGTVYTKVKEGKGANCRGALIGSTLQAAVRQAGCTQVARATYVAQQAGLMATIGVFNLDSYAAASQAAAKAGHNSFVAQLQSKTGPAHKIGQGTGIEEALVKGHYLVMVWAEYTNLQAPKNQADRTRLESFMNLLIAKTANLSLSYRMVYGKPMPTPSATG